MFYPEKLVEFTTRLLKIQLTDLFFNSL